MTARTSPTPSALAPTDTEGAATRYPIPDTRHRYPLTALPVPPLASQHRVHRRIRGDLVEHQRFALDPLEGETEALGHSTAAHVADGGADHDAVHLVVVEEEVEQRPHRLPDDASPLVGRAQPVADLGLAVDQIDTRSASPRHHLVIEQTAVKGSSRFLLTVGSRDECGEIRDGGGVRHPRHPLGEALSIGIDRDEERRRILRPIRPHHQPRGESHRPHVASAARAMYPA